MWDANARTRFLEFSKDHKYGDLYHVAIQTGMRQEELRAGLCWERRPQ